jgi:hypothetical protein
MRLALVAAAAGDPGLGSGRAEVGYCAAADPDTIDKVSARMNRDRLPGIMVVSDG